MTEQSFDKQAKENLSLSPQKMDKFLKQAHTLRHNLKLRQRQKKERDEKCTHSK